MKQAILRKTLAGDWTAFTFSNKNRFFFVKNYTEDDIYVSFESDTSTDEAFKITTGVGEEVAISYDSIDRDIYYVNTIYVKGTGEVEVQALDIYSPRGATLDTNTLVAGDNDAVNDNTLVLNSDNTEIEDNTLEIE